MNTLTHSFDNATPNVVLAKTFKLVGWSMVPTAIMAYLVSLIPTAFYQAHPIGMIVAFVALFLGSFGLMYYAMKARSEPQAIFAMMAFASVMGAMMGPTIAATLHMKNGASLIALSAGLTGAALFALTSYAVRSKKDFSFMGGFLFAGLIVVILASIVGIFIQSTALQLTISAVSVIIFLGYILFDVSRVVTGGETNYIFAAIAIYLDIINLFLNILRILGIMSGDD